MIKNYNRNPLGSNQWTQKKSTEEIQKIINKHPQHWLKQDFMGKGKNNSKIYFIESSSLLNLKLI